MPSIPSVVIHFDFYAHDNPGWVIKGEVNKNGEVNNNCDYSDYCEREEAFKNENLKMSEYDYYDYSGNKEKTEGNFDIENNFLNEKQINEYRQLEMQSKKNGCVKYLGYIPFDNDFLIENKVINNSILDTKKMKNIIRLAMSEMILKSKKFDESNTVWTAAIHINTAHVHAHITMFEKEKLSSRKNDCIEQFAITSAKSKIINTIVGSDFSKKLTDLTRNILIPEIKNQFSNEVDFNQVISQLPERQQLWSYNRKDFKPYKKIVNEYVSKIIDTTPTLQNNFKTFMKELDSYSEKCKKYYGEGKQHLYENYKKNKLEDFYSRAGISLLNELKEFSKNSCVLSEKESEFFSGLQTTEISETNIDTSENSERFYSDDIINPDDISFSESPYILSEKEIALFDGLKINDADIDTYENFEQLNFDDLDFSESSCVLSEKENEDYKIEWSDNYKAAKKYLSGTKEVKKDYNKALELFSLEASQNNILAIHDIGYMYFKNLINVDDSPVLAQEFFQSALNGFLSLKDNDKMSDYINYRIGKMYSLGYGTEQDYKKAFEHFMKAPNNKYAQFSIGSLYQYGNGVEQSDEYAFHYYKLSADQENAFAQYKVAEALQNGKGVSIDKKQAEYHYKKAFENFIIIDEENPDHNLKYKIGYMYMKGLGTEINIEKAKEYFMASVNENDNSKMALAKIYFNDQNSHSEQKQLAVKWLHELSEKENQSAQYTLGKIYLSGEFVPQDKALAVKYLTASAEQDNQYAQFALGKFFLSDREYKDTEKALPYLNKSAENGNQFAQYTLGKIYLSGEFVPKDKALAVKYLTASANQENQYAQYALGKFFLSDSEYKDTEKALPYLNKSAENGNQFAQYTLGKIYLSGEVTPQDKTLAIKHLTASADQNNPYAQFALGKFYLKDNEYKNPELGKEYLQKSASQGIAYAQKYLDRLGKIKRRREFLKEKTQIRHKNHDNTLRSIVNQLEGHLEQLKSEFNYEEDMKLAQEQNEIEMLIAFERT